MPDDFTNSISSQNVLQKDNMFALPHSFKNRISDYKQLCAQFE